MRSLYIKTCTRVVAHMCASREYLLPWLPELPLHAVLLAPRSSRSDLWPNDLRRPSARDRAVAPNVSNVKVAMSNALNELVVFKLCAERARRWRRQVPTLYIISYHTKYKASRRRHHRGRGVVSLCVRACVNFPLCAAVSEGITVSGARGD